MAIKDGKTVILTDVANEAEKNKPHNTIQEAAFDVFGNIPMMLEEVKREAKDSGKYRGDFFIEVLVRIEKFAINTVHPYVNVTKTCPNPHYKQCVYRYIKAKDELELLWLLPDQAHAAFYRVGPEKFHPVNVQYLRDHDAGKLQLLANNINKSYKE